MVTTLEHFCGTFLHCRLPAQPSEVTCEVVSLEVARQCDSVFLLSELFMWRYNPCIYHEYFFRTVQPMEYMGNSYFVLKNQVIKAERRMLKVSGCHCCHNKALLLRKTANAVLYVWLAVHPLSCSVKRMHGNYYLIAWCKEIFFFRNLGFVSMSSTLTRYECGYLLWCIFTINGVGCVAFLSTLWPFKPPPNSQTGLHTFLLRIVERIWFNIKAFSLC